MVRFLISVMIFLASIGVALIVLLLAALIITHGAGGTGLFAVAVVGSPARNSAAILVLAVLGFLSFWLSGKLTKA
jgi:hypothetical protein